MLSQGILSILWLLGRACNKPWERRRQEQEAPLICLWLQLFVSKKQEENPKSHNLQVSFARDTPESSTPHCGLNLVTRLNSLERMALQGTTISAPTRAGSSILIPFFKHLFVASSFNVGFSFCSSPPTGFLRIKFRKKLKNLKKKKVLLLLLQVIVSCFISIKVIALQKKITELIGRGFTKKSY